MPHYYIETNWVNTRNNFCILFNLQKTFLNINSICICLLTLEPLIHIMNESWIFCSYPCPHKWNKISFKLLNLIKTCSIFNKFKLKLLLQGISYIIMYYIHTICIYKPACVYIFNLGILKFSGCEISCFIYSFKIIIKRKCGLINLSYVIWYYIFY